MTPRALATALLVALVAAAAAPTSGAASPIIVAHGTVSLTGTEAGSACAAVALVDFALEPATGVGAVSVDDAFRGCFASTDALIPGDCVVAEDSAVSCMVPFTENRTMSLSLSPGGAFTYVFDNAVTGHHVEARGVLFRT